MTSVFFPINLCVSAPLREIAFDLLSFDLLSIDILLLIDLIVAKQTIRIPVWQTRVMSLRGAVSAW